MKVTTKTRKGYRIFKITGVMPADPPNFVVYRIKHVRDHNGKGEDGKGEDSDSVYSGEVQKISQK